MMKTMIEKNKQKVYEVTCNKCGKLIAIGEALDKVDYLSITKEWGYFSKKDNEVHSFDLCEECYDELLRSFEINTLIKKNTTYI